MLSDWKVVLNDKNADVEKVKAFCSANFKGPWCITKMERWGDLGLYFILKSDGERFSESFEYDGKDKGGRNKPRIHREAIFWSMQTDDEWYRTGKIVYEYVPK